MTYLVAAPLPAIPKAEGVRARPDSDLGLEVKILKVTEEKGLPDGPESSRALILLRILSPPVGLGDLSFLQLPGVSLPPLV